MMRSKLLLVLALCAGLSCAQTGNGQEEDMSTPPVGDGGAEGDGGNPETCFMGEPKTEPELLNRCTDAERILRPHRIPANVWDGKGPLPPPPL